MHVFVTGGNGFIGSAVVRALVTAGHTVRCLLRPSSNTCRIDTVDYTPVIGDVRQVETLRKGMAGCDAAIHLASLSSWDLIDSPQMHDVVEVGTRNVLEAAREESLSRVVYVSSVTAVAGTRRPEVNDEETPYNLGAQPGLTYAHYKHRAEQLCQEAQASGLPVVIVNPAETYGPDDTGMITAGTLVDFAKSRPVLVCRGGTSIVHVDDVAKGIVKAMERGRGGQRYILGGENLELGALADIALDLMGMRARVWTVPNVVFKAITALAKAFRVPLPYNPKVVPYATRYWFVSSSKAQRELGVSFRPARETLAPTIAWLESSGRI